MVKLVEIKDFEGENGFYTGMRVRVVSSFEELDGIVGTLAGKWRTNDAGKQGWYIDLDKEYEDQVDYMGEYLQLWEHRLRIVE